MRKQDFYYDLPEELIAQHPAEKREESRLMLLDKKTGEIQHRHFYDIIDYLEEGDCLVLNNTKVIPARIFGICGERHFEVTLHKNIALDTWLAFIKNSKNTCIYLCCVI